MYTTRWFLRIALASFLLSAAACSEFATVEGTVTLDGAPLSQATVSFVPVDKQSGGTRDATARADAVGRFRIKTSKRDGVFPGQYKVLISRRLPPKGLENPRNAGEAIQATQRSVESVPKKYTMPDETPFVIDIPSRGLNGLELSLQSNP